MTLQAAQDLLLKYKAYLDSKDITELEYTDLVKSIDVSKIIVSTQDEINLKYNIHNVVKYAVQGICTFL